MPVGSNKLGTYLARSDKWYRRHIYDSFKGGLGLCPQVMVLSCISMRCDVHFTDAANSVLSLSDIVVSL